MPKSLFDEELTVSGGCLEVAGDYDADREPRPTFVCWLVAQDDIVARGVATPSGYRWADSEDEPRNWKDGPARAVAMTATLTHEGVTSYSWWMRVNLKRG